MSLKIALPKGRLMNATAGLLETAGWGLDGYDSRSRFYRPTSSRFPDVMLKILNEKDIPIQVAVGNYDLGICGSEWVDELLARYPGSAIVKTRELGYGQRSLVITGNVKAARDKAKSGKISIASEYPNLAETFALRSRFKIFNIFPVYGAAEAYLPDIADLALVTGESGELKILASAACVVANRDALQTRDFSAVLNTLKDIILPETELVPEKSGAIAIGTTFRTDADDIWLAFPDGHQQPPALALFKRANIEIDEKELQQGCRCLRTGTPGLFIKVIRPQDMPLQVANGNFDLAVTGKDWLAEHLNQFPSSPVQELVDLKFGGVRIVAVVCNSEPVNNIQEFRERWSKETAPLRVISEYINIADRYAREKRLGMYRIIPTWGASEAFLPEDADLLIENTQTGKTLATHNLKIIDTIFESTARLIGNKASLSGAKAARIAALGKKLKAAVEA